MTSTPAKRPAPPPASSEGAGAQRQRDLDAAKALLSTLTDRNAILDAFFDHAARSFRFCVLFVVRDQIAGGRRVHGLGAPGGLVARLAVPLKDPGVLAQAHEEKRVIVVTPAADGVDGPLIGSLGRAMPQAVVAPVVVAGRVVAMILGEGPVEALEAEAQEVGVAPIEIARDAMALWTDAVGDAFEALIVSRKLETAIIPSATSSQPRLGSGPPSSRTSVRPSAGPTSQRPPLIAKAADLAPAAPAAPAPAPAPARRAAATTIGFATVGAIAVLGIAAYRFDWLSPSDKGPEVVLVGTDQLAGWPDAVDLGATIERARSASGLGARAELVGLRAELVKGGRVEAAADAPAERAPLAFTFAADDQEHEFGVDGAGMHGARKVRQPMCEGGPCRRAVAAPRSTLAQVWDAAQELGARPGDRLSATYLQGASGPEWSLSAEGRGLVRLADASRKPLGKERLRPPALALSAIPGAPRVDPLEALAIARGQSALGLDAAILEIDARGVGSDGRVDLKEANRSITYRLSEPESVPPAERRWRHVKLTQEGMPVTPIATDHDAPPPLLKGLVDQPRCTFADAWARGGFAPDAKVRIIYRAATSQPESGQWTLDAASLTEELIVSDKKCLVAAGKARD